MPLLNPSCNLSTSSDFGCCYNQDQRKKLKSKNKRMRDMHENLPIVVENLEYQDGIGDKKRRMVCYTSYCPSCQEYWHQRVQGPKTSVAFYCEGIQYMQGMPMQTNRVQYEQIAPNESMGDAISRIYHHYPTARLMMDGAKRVSEPYPWNAV